MDTKKTKAQLLLEEAIRRRDAGEFQRQPTWEDLEGLDPNSIKYGLLRAQIDPEYAAMLDQKFEQTANSAKAVHHRLSQGLPR